MGGGEECNRTGASCNVRGPPAAAGNQHNAGGCPVRSRHLLPVATQSLLMYKDYPDVFTLQQWYFGGGGLSYGPPRIAHFPLFFLRTSSKQLVSRVFHCRSLFVSQLRICSVEFPSLPRGLWAGVQLCRRLPLVPGRYAVPTACSVVMLPKGARLLLTCDPSRSRGFRFPNISGFNFPPHHKAFRFPSCFIPVTKSFSVKSFFCASGRRTGQGIG